MTDEAVRAMADRIEELDRVCSEWADASQANYQRAKTAEAKLAKAVEEAYAEGFAEGSAGDWIEGDYSKPWAKSQALAELTGGKDE